MLRRNLTTLTIAGTVLLVLAACGDAQPGAAKASESEIEKYASMALEEEIGVKPDRINCPSGMPLKVNEDMRCTLTHEGDSTGMTVKVASVDDGDFHLDVEVDEKGATVSKAVLETSIADQLEAQTGDRPAGVECPGAISGSEGVEVECVLTAPAGDEYGAKITVSGVEGSKINYDIEVDSEPM